MKRLINALPMLGVFATVAFAQSGDLSGVGGEFSSLAGSVLKIFIGVVGAAFVGLLIMGGLQLTTNRPRGLGMIGGGIVGALLAGLAFTIVSHLTGGNIGTT